MICFFIGTLLKFFFLTTPFFALSMFLAMTVSLFALWAILRMAARTEERLGQQVLPVLMRLTGLVAPGPDGHDGRCGVSETIVQRISWAKPKQRKEN